MTTAIELRKFFGESGTVYYVVWADNELNWKAFVETPRGFKLVEAKGAAIDCGAKGDRSELNTHQFWSQLWPANSEKVA
jgi:hypothetical protein